jgi:iron complex outermembrane receptor protein
MILVFWNSKLRMENQCLTSRLARFDNRQITTEENGTLGEEGYFKAIDKSLIVSMFWGIKRS